ncbi:hypothetical protein BSKO_10141 [Bryopsis sp. KO-2023]|nr:hypothetical protein BSKO_10141 [Bryopsis sp. KO-2023]
MVKFNLGGAINRHQQTAVLRTTPTLRLGKMSSTLLEQTRGFHEDVERLEHLIVKDLKEEPRGHQDQLYQNLRVRKMLDTIEERSSKLARIYEDVDNARRDEIDALAGDNIFSKFYDRLKDIKDYHRKYPNTDITEAENDEMALKFEPEVEFSGEESMGRYLDLHQHYNEFINAKFGGRVDYFEYLGKVDKFPDIERRHKFSKAYRSYLDRLLAYLESFYERTQPLGALPKQYKRLEEEFAKEFDDGICAGWADKGLGNPPVSSIADVIDVDAFVDLDEIESIGAERLKEALGNLGLKCGGTTRQRAERLMNLKGKANLEEVDPKLFAKGVRPASMSTPEQQERLVVSIKAIAFTEAKICKVLEMLGSVLEETKGKVERKQAQTLEELQAELEEQEQVVEEEGSDEEEEYIYNPLKLPLGWDGKPIPYWLYKLHGLNQEFKCEICGNYSYWGRRAFEKHFKEWRHQNGMRALGIPNNKNFYEITKIEDAVALWENMKRRDKGGWRAEVDEEYEDQDGNVYSKKTYEDMKRQGLIQ